MVEYTNIFHILHSNLGIKDSEQHLVLMYHCGLHRYIQTKMDFLDISSLGVSYRYAVKIYKKVKKQSKWEKHGQSKANLKRSSPRCRERRVMVILRKTLKSGVSSTIFLSTTMMNFAQYSHWWLSSKTKSQTLTWTLIPKIIKGDRSLMSNPMLLLQLQQSNQKRILRRRCGIVSHGFNF
jgi:hypothetical protein